MGKKIEKRGDNVHELRSSDFIGAWIGSCLEKGSASDQRRGARSLAVTGREEGFNGTGISGTLSP